MSARQFHQRDDIPPQSPLRHSETSHNSRQSIKVLCLVSDVSVRASGMRTHTLRRQLSFIPPDALMRPHTILVGVDSFFPPVLNITQS